jgi:uncharacterized membrane protein YfcA
MSNAATGFWSAIGTVLGGAAGAYAGNRVAHMRPRVRYANAKRSRGQAVEDAMVIGGATGALVGAFLGGTIAGEETTPPQLRK